MQRLCGAARRCVLIQQPSTGYQHIDVEAAAREGIPVANAAGANTFAVAEHTIMLILACLKKLLLAHEKTERAEWAQDEMPLHGVFELWGKTLGIIGSGTHRQGSGQEGKALRSAHRSTAAATASPWKRKRSWEYSYCGLDQLVAESDIISIHTPLTPQTENLFDADRIARMKPNAILINVSRGTHC